MITPQAGNELPSAGIKEHRKIHEIKTIKPLLVDRSAILIKIIAETNRNSTALCAVSLLSANYSETSNTAFIGALKE